MQSIEHSSLSTALVIIAVCNKTNITLIYVVFINRGRSVFIALLLSTVQWPLKMFEYPLVAPRAFRDVISSGIQNVECVVSNSDEDELVNSY